MPENKSYFGGLIDDELRRKALSVLAFQGLSNTKWLTLKIKELIAEAEASGEVRYERDSQGKDA